MYESGMAIPHPCMYMYLQYMLYQYINYTKCLAFQKNVHVLYMNQYSISFPFIVHFEIFFFLSDLDNKILKPQISYIDSCTKSDEIFPLITSRSKLLLLGYVYLWEVSLESVHVSDEIMEKH